ncbi:DUF943 family protein [Mixta intestinalis]|jgi:hypothetical protein|uniref:Uncharacterized protein n=1 Tax=Mixta intestinalis TaxID=1615494 RepID=A0A6P1PVF3_9GAMM|nr:DUF943 family protein [Mixta intestinalis]QHM70024.1 hypothetical protein C7M51_00284 [Mixta intestinalis]
MKIKYKKCCLALIVAGFVIAIYTAWLSLRPVNIIAVHQRSNNFSAILVENFPLTDKGKIAWWLKNSYPIKEKYNIPVPAEDGFFSITFWLFGDGYKEQGKYDRLCFDEIKSSKKCIEKNPVLTVEKTRNRGIFFTIYDGSNYRIDENGKIIKITESRDK